MGERERFLPWRLGPLTAELCALAWPDGEDRATEFAAFCRLVGALCHFELHEREQVLIAAWDGASEREDAAATLSRGLRELLDQANYTHVTAHELEAALSQESLLRLRLTLDIDNYDEMLICRRGSHSDTVDIPRWAGLRTTHREFTVDERVVIYARTRDARWFRERDSDPASLGLIPGHVSLKQFQNVPRADIEMLLPSAQVRFRRIDTVLVGLPALISGVAVLSTKLLPTLGLMFLLIGAWLGFRDQSPQLDQTSLVVLFGGLVTIGGFVVRQWSKLKNRRLEYLKTLSENLYFRTLGDGPGVVHTLLASAAEQDIAEILLAYRFLLATPQGVTVDELDRAIEAWGADASEADIDFDVHDAITKLRNLDLIQHGDVLRPRPLDEALEILDRRWDNLFQYS